LGWNKSCIDVKVGAQCAPTLTSWNPLGQFRPVTGLLYLYLNFLEPSGPVQACNGTALPLLINAQFNNYSTVTKY